MRRYPDAVRYRTREEKGSIEDSRLDIITDLMDLSLSKLQELVMDREFSFNITYERYLFQKKS